MLRGGESSFLLILVYFFHEHCIKSFGSFKCFGPFFNMYRTKCDNYIFSYLGWSWSGTKLRFLVKVREKHIVDENSGKVREKFFLKKRMNPVFIKQQRTVLNLSAVLNLILICWNYLVRRSFFLGKYEY